MSVEPSIEVSPLDHEPERERRRQPSMRWATVRLFAFWVPIAAALAMALWQALLETFEPWSHRDDGPRVLDSLAPQLLFALTLVLAGRFETARGRRTDGTDASVGIYWEMVAVLIVLGVAALWSIPRPLAQ